MSQTPESAAGRDPDDAPGGGAAGAGSPAVAPAPLLAAAGVVLVQGLLTTMFGLAEVLDLSTDRLVMGVTTSAFFIAYGVLLVAAAWGLRTLRGWARGPVLLAQLIWLGLAWNFRGGETVVIAVFLAVTGVVVLAGLLNPRSVEALGA